MIASRKQARDGPRSDGFFDSSELGSPLEPSSGIRYAADLLSAMRRHDGARNSGEGVVDGAASNGIAFVARSAGMRFIEVTAAEFLFSDDRMCPLVVRRASTGGTCAPSLANVPHGALKSPSETENEGALGIGQTRTRRRVDDGLQVEFEADQRRKRRRQESGRVGRAARIEDSGGDL